MPLDFALPRWRTWLIVLGLGLMSTIGLSMPAALAQQPGGSASADTARPDTAMEQLPLTMTEPIVIHGKKLTEQELEAYMRRVRQYQKLREYVKRVYPIAQDIAEIVNRVDAKMAKLEDKKAKRTYVKNLQERLFDKYEDRLRALNRTQGKILIKLTYRETGNTAYHLINDYKNWGSASFWQVIAKIYGATLKKKYIPEENAAIEAIIKEIEGGEKDSYQVKVNR